ncbi:MAG: hypothetical protein PHQ47_03685 [Candidatus Portnoybacteria bacterium]|nr:hypothetical protein [Candidatus Portnoybacteria bacterium]
MHDFHLANEIVKIAKEYAKREGLLKISKIVLKLGDIIEHGENISSENLRHNINLLMPCEVKISKIKGDSWRLVSIEGNNR